MRTSRRFAGKRGHAVPLDPRPEDPTVAITITNGGSVPLCRHSSFEIADRSNDKVRRTKPNYNVGYGHPPKAAQFKPGQSGNPKGRKSKPKSVRDQMQAILSKRIPITEGGRTKRLTLQDLILRNVANKAAKGHLKAAGFVFNLLNSAEFAETEKIDQNTLSPDDPALFDRLLGQHLGSAAPLAIAVGWAAFCFAKV